MSRLTSDWVFSPLTSANEEIKGDLRMLRGRSREMVRNEPLPKRYVAMVAENVIGPDGIRLQARVKTKSGDLDNETNAKIEEAWKRWSKAENASVDGRLSWLSIQSLAVRTRAQDGEVLIRMIRGYPNDFGFALQMIDPDQLDHEYSGELEGGNMVRMGVEMNGWGKPVAYHIWNYHPSEYGRTKTRMRVPADEIIHYFIPGRVGQARGVPELHAVMRDAKMLAGYQEAELVAARVGACQMGFFKPGENGAPVDPNASANTPLSIEAEAGTFHQIDGDFVPFNPNHPAQAYPSFVKANQRSIATGLNVSYNSLANDLEGVNYSSMRHGMYSERDAWRMQQNETAEQIHARIYPMWLKYALLYGGLKLESLDYTKYLAHQWQPRGWEAVNPKEDVETAAMEIALGLTSRKRLCAERGIDFEENLADLAEEQDLAAEYDVTLTTDVKKNPNAPTDADQNTSTSKPAEALSDDDDRAGSAARRFQLQRSGG